MNNFSDKICEIKTVIFQLEREYQETQGLILAEDDLKINLCRLLYPYFSDHKDSIDPGIKASKIHSEIKFFDENARLLIRPDITIIEPNNLSILHSLTYTEKDNSIT